MRAHEPHHSMPEDTGPSGYPPRDRFITRVCIVAAAVALLFLAWIIRHALILAFAGVVVAVIVSSVADPLRRRTGMQRGYAVLVAALVILLILGFFGWLAMPEAQSQVSQLIERIPASLDEIDRRFGAWFPDDLMQSGGVVRNIAARLASWSTALFATVTTVILVIVAGIFLATRPRTYRDGLVSLFVPNRQEPLREALNRAGHALKAWLRAQLLSMLVIGAGVTAATWLLGLPSPFALGLIAGLLEFVPIIGPIAAAIPALLLAMMISPAMVLWTGLTYFAIEQIESNIVLPFAQSEVADLPPALLIFAFVAFGAVFGLAGVVVSAPLSVALYSLVNDLYVKPLNQPHREAASVGGGEG
ncbi:AI-2E family transporter [Roseitranquillus sediminis]|uniref:AI-2E family transporter n=1 Tax=Roseitranquillus sediminis TaxID=2809051 RepID=UPI001D0C5641|nr:AI-2E family transporter [Roseitranquillus sediminis]MBM9593124.1 AI-2E family transporter [Roseitranquillus sediminis]